MGLDQETSPIEQSSKEAVQKLIKPKSSKTPLIVMAVLTTLSLVLVGYLGYQNIQLRKKITQTTALPTSTPDSMVDWETYDGTGYSFAYPTGLVSNTKDSQTLLSQEEGFVFNIGVESFDLLNFSSQLTLDPEIYTDSKNRIWNTELVEVAGAYNFKAEHNSSEKVHSVSIQTSTEGLQKYLGEEIGYNNLLSEIKKIALQILSTFEFTQ